MGGVLLPNILVLTIDDSLSVQIAAGMTWEKRAALVEILRGNAYKHMFYAGKKGSKANSLTEGDRNGEVKLDPPV